MDCCHVLLKQFFASSIFKENVSMKTFTFVSLLVTSNVVWCAEPILSNSGVQVDNTVVNTAAAATPPAVPPVPAARGPALDLALKAAQTAINSCLAIQQKVAVSVLDSGGVVRVLLASDGAVGRAVQSGTNKALTALAFKQASGQIGEKIKTDQHLASEVAANPNYNTRAGAILLETHGEIIGAIGVGGARGSEKDEACAIAGLKEIQRQLE